MQDEHKAIIEKMKDYFKQCCNILESVVRSHAHASIRAHNVPKEVTYMSEIAQHIITILCHAGEVNRRYETIKQEVQYLRKVFQQKKVEYAKSCRNVTNLIAHLDLLEQEKHQLQSKVSLLKESLLQNNGEER